MNVLINKFNLMLVGGNTTLLSSLYRLQAKAALEGGSIYVAEAPGEGVLGIDIWYGPGET